MLEAYFEARVSDDLRRRYQAMKCASLLRETMWSMVSEIHSDIDFDYSSYTAENLRRFESTWQDFRNS
jgi:thiamine kinase-like enzyme